MNRNLNPEEFGYPEPTGASEDRTPSLLQRWDVDPDEMLDVYDAAENVPAVQEPVPLAELHSYQPDVERPSLQHMIESPTFDQAPPIDVVRHQGKMYVQDGSHRANAAMLRGRTHFDANVKETPL